MFDYRIVRMNPLTIQPKKREPNACQGFSVVIKTRKPSASIMDRQSWYPLIFGRRVDWRRVLSFCGKDYIRKAVHANGGNREIGQTTLFDFHGRSFSHFFCGFVSIGESSVFGESSDFRIFGSSAIEELARAGG